ncbi:MAG: methyltransferase type 11 [Eubacterium sp.]|nr:methyltransferase type 11 [Eubacterium sp.]
MRNPWEEINLNAYEAHMRLNSVFQIQTLNEMMKEQFYSYPVHSVMILGIAGGNGLEHIDTQIIHTVYGVDINKSYLDTCIKRYPDLQGTFCPIHTDLTQNTIKLPYADLVVANLIVEYIGYDCFQKVIKHTSPKYVSAIIQINTDTSFVSSSPYLHAFDRLNEVHHQMEEASLVDAMKKIGYRKIAETDKDLPNGKKFARIDFTY